MPQELSNAMNTPLSLTSLGISLAIGVVLALMLRWHYERFGSTLSNRAEFAQVFPFILLTTILIISVVKSSLALSLGLVGALSIVRFRTPIKEPEELAYLFLAIAMGLGLGAAQTLATVLAGSAILIVAALVKSRPRQKRSQNLYLSVEWQSDSDDPTDGCLDKLNEVVSRHVLSSDLRRFDVRDSSIETTYIIDVAAPGHLSALTDDLRESYPNAGITFLDQSQMPSV